MESVFDHNVSERELDSLLIKGPREDYLKRTSVFKRYSDLYHLYTLRGNLNKADEFYRKMLNE